MARTNRQLTDAQITWVIQGTDGQLYLQGDSPTAHFINTLGEYQFGQVAFTMYSSFSSLGNNAGVNMGSVITDVGISEANFVIDKVDYQGNFVDSLFSINLNTNITSILQGFSLPALAAPSGQTYMLVIDDTGTVTSQPI